MQKKAALGRGMNAILGKNPSVDRKNNNPADPEGLKHTDTDNNVSRETFSIRLSMIEPNASQPRKKFDETALDELAASIKEHGVLQPILVRKKGQMYEIIVGERRWRAAKAAGLKEIPAVVRDMSPEEASEAALIENIQREDLSAVEEANAYRALISEYGLTQDELAKKLSRSRTSITNSMRLLQLGDDVIELLESGALTAGHARAILAITNKEDQSKAAAEAVSRGLNVRQTEKLAKSYNSASASKQKKPQTDSADARELFISSAEHELTEIMQTKVIIKQTGKKKGHIEIEYYSDDDLNDLIDRLSRQ